MLRRLLPLMFLLSVGLSAHTLEQLASDPQRWPTEVTVVTATRADVIKGGKPSGLMLVGAGKKLVVTGVAADGVTGKLGGVLVKVPVNRTDLLGPPAESPAPAASEPGAPAEATPPVAAAKPAASNAMQRLLDGRLARLANNRLEPVTAEQLAGVKYYALYYSASWCGPCRQFTPGFVRTYRQLKQAHPEFEVVFVSADHSAGDMLDYMKHDQMPWLAVRFDQRNEKILSYSGPGIPCLVLVDAKGQVLSDSFEGDAYRGPDKVLQDTRRILQQGR